MGDLATYLQLGVWRYVEGEVANRGKILRAQSDDKGTAEITSNRPRDSRPVFS